MLFQQRFLDLLSQVARGTRAGQLLPCNLLLLLLLLRQRMQP